MSNVIRDLVAFSVLGHLMHEKFFECFESTGKAMDTVVMKNIFLLRYEIHYSPLEFGY